MGLQTDQHSAPRPELPSGYRRRLAKLHTRGIAGLLLSGGLLAISFGAAVAALPHAWPAWIALEGAFLALWFSRKRRLDRVPDAHHPEGHCAISAFGRFSRSIPNMARDYSCQDLVSMWFDGPEESEVKRGNVRDLLAYGFGYRSAREYEAAGHPHVPDIIVDQVEAAWDTQYEEGHNPRLNYMAHLREPIRALPKPLAWYLLAEGLGGVKHAVLRAAGFRCARHAGFLYYTYGLPPASAAAAARRGEGTAVFDEPPIVFCHGVGLGLLPYLHFVLKLAGLGRPVVAVEWPHLCMRWTSHIPTVDEGTSALLGIMDTYGIDRAAFAGHSFGTFFLSRLNRLAPHRVAAMALVDPVCMCMWSGHLIRSFVYRPHMNKSGAITWFISRDIHTAAAVARNFFWSEYNMWPDTFPDHSLVVLSGQDDLVPARHVASMVLHETNARLMLIPDDKHAAFLFNLDWQEKVLAGVWSLIDGASAAAGGGGEEEEAAGAAGKARRLVSAAAARVVSHGHSDSAFSLSLSPSYSNSSSTDGGAGLGFPGGGGGCGGDASPPAPRGRNADAPPSRGREASAASAGKGGVAAAREAAGAAPRPSASSDDDVITVVA